MELTKEQIIEINKKCPENQGIFVEPNGIPLKIKEPVIYCRYETGGYSGGNWSKDSDPRPYTTDIPKDKMKVLEIVFMVLCPNISFLQYKQIENLIDENDYSEHEYYGNCTDWKVVFIQTSKLYNLLNEFGF